MDIVGGFIGLGFLLLIEVFLIVFGKVDKSHKK